jgi:hypothetical protein
LQNLSASRKFLMATGSTGRLGGETVTWIWENREWVFSGVGIAVLGMVFTFFKLFIPGDAGKSLTMKQRGGAFSNNIQFGQANTKADTEKQDG